MMDITQLHALEHPLIRKLNPKHVEYIAAGAMEKSYNQGDYLFRVDEEADYLYLMCSGKVALEMSVPGRNALSIQTIGPGGLVGWSWLFPPYKWHFDARAVEPVRAVCVDARYLRQQCEDNHELGYELLKEFSAVMFERLIATRFQLINVYDLY